MEAGLICATPSVARVLTHLLCEHLAAESVTILLEMVFVFGIIYAVNMSQLCRRWQSVPMLEQKMLNLPRDFPRETFR